MCFFPELQQHLQDQSAHLLKLKATVEVPDLPLITGKWGRPFSNKALEQRPSLATADKLFEGGGGGQNSTNSSDKSGRKWHLMNVIIVSFPLVFHIINLRECSCISNWALTKSIQTLCCAATQIVCTHTHTHGYNTPQLSFIYSSSDKYHLHTRQSRAKRASIHCQRLWIPSLSLAAPPLSPLFPTMHRVAYQLPMIYKLSDEAVGADSHRRWKK